MEKKGNRNSPVARGAASDSKKDGVSSRQLPRGCRRREPAGNSVSTKSEPSRKPQPQRVKTIDKRPKPRQFFSPLVARNEATCLDPEFEAELGSVFLPGSKKQSLNHLLNFSYSPRGSVHHHTQNEGGHKGKGGRGKLLATKKHRYNKEHFLQANCQFIVNEFGDYKQYLNNPDALVDWDFVEQINVQVSEHPSCPICLYPPMAAKMTRCGHIYCWSCILHYLSLSDKPSRKCPICFDDVDKKDLKSVVSMPHNTFNLTETITFKLMKRLRGSLMAYPVDVNIRDDNIIFNVSEKGVEQVYSKLLLAKNDDILSVIERERRELNEQILSDENTLEKCFIEEALVLLEDRRRSVTSSVSVCDSENQNFDVVKLEQDVGNLEINDSGGGATGEAEDFDTSCSSSSSKYHYFYQASDGQHIYLHAINARMLEHTYGCLENSPKTLSGVILEKEGGSMTEDLRKRLRYLQHLPVTCQFEVAEIQLRQPVVSKDTLEHFRDQLDIRKKRRQRRAKEEKRREKRIEVEENRKMGRYPVPNLRLDSEVQFPDFGAEPRLRTDSEGTMPSERSSSPDLTGTASSLSLEDAQNSSCAGPSFAMMLATEKKNPPSWPNLNPARGPLTPLKLVNVTGSKMKAAGTTVLRVPSDEEVDPENYEPVPSFNRSIGDAIAQALELAEKEDEDPTFGKKKKRKSKQKVLFATTVGYSGN